MPRTPRKSKKYAPNSPDYRLPSGSSAPAVIQMDLYKWKLAVLAPLPHAATYKRKIVLFCTSTSCTHTTRSTWPLNSTNLKSHWRNRHLAEYEARVQAFNALKYGNNAITGSLSATNASVPLIQAFSQSTNTTAGNPPHSSALSQNCENQVLFDAGHYKGLVADFLMKQNLPFNTAYCPELNRLLEYARLCLASSLPPISCHIMRDEVRVTYVRERNLLKERLAKLDGKFAITLSEWKSGNNTVFFGVTLHFSNDKFRLESHVIGFEILNENPNEFLARVLNEYGIRNRIISITTNNTGPLAVVTRNFATEMKASNVEFDGDIGCVGHILNLAASTILNYTFFKPNKSKYILDQIQGVEEINKRSVDRARTAAKRVISVVKAIREKTSLKTEFSKNVTTKRKLEDNNIVLRNKQTRWLSTYKMLNRFYHVRREVHKLLYLAEKKPPSKRSGFNLNTYVISKSDWNQINLLRRVLSPFEEAALKLQQDTCYTVGLTIPYISHILMAIKDLDTAEFETQNPLLVLGLREAYDKILKYYPLQDANIDQLKHLYLATVLDPRLKLQSLKDSMLSYSIVKEVEKYLNEVYEKYNKEHEKSQRSSYVQISKSKYNSDSESDMSRIIFARKNQTGGTNEIFRYLAENRPLESCDVGEWYEARRDSYPVLYMMAKDYLCSPAMSVPAKSLLFQVNSTNTNKQNGLLHDAIKLQAISKSSFLGDNVVNSHLDSGYSNENTGNEARDMSINCELENNRTPGRKGLFAGIGFDPKGVFADDEEETDGGSDDEENFSEDSAMEDYQFYYGSD